MSEPEPDEDEYGDVTFEVTFTTKLSAGIPTVEEIKRCLYHGIEIIDTEDAIDVQRT